MTPVDGCERPGLPRPVTIVIVAWNGLGHTRRCLDSLAPSIRRLPVEVVVVDNGSTDGTAEFLRGLRGVRCITHSRNLGFAAGVNAGIGAADPASDIVLLNNDVVLEDPNWLPGLADVARRPAAGVVSARLHYPDGRLQDAGTDLVFEPFALRRFGVFEPDAGQYGSVRPVSTVSFACVYIRREVIERIGLLDAERYFCYHEDIDYCLRAWEAGFAVWCAGTVRIMHVEHASSGAAAPKLSARSERSFRSRWDGSRNPAARRTIVLRWPEGVDWERRELLRTLAIGLEARGWRTVPRRIQGDGTALPFEEMSADCCLDDLWRITAQRDAAMAAAAIEPGANGRGLRVTAGGREEIWSLADGDAGGAPALRLSVAPDRDYFRPRAASRHEGFCWLAVLAGPRREETWALLCAAARELSGLRCLRMEKLAVPYDLQWSERAVTAQAPGGRLEVRRHCWAAAAERMQLYAEADACVLASDQADLGLVALELAAAGVPIVATEEDLPCELRTPGCAGLVPSGGAFAAGLRGWLANWTQHPAAARCTGHRAALATAGRSWTRELNLMSERLEALVG